MTATDYCTLDEVEAYAGVNFSDGIGPSDAQIATMISVASRLMDAYANVQFAGTESHTEYSDTAFGLAFITLSERPVVSVTSIHSISPSGVETLLSKGRVPNDNDYYLADAESGLVRFHFAFTEAMAGRLKTTYLAGAATPPADVKMATILHVVRSCARASMNDENCMDRVKEFWRELIKDTTKEYEEMLAQVKTHKQIGVATFGQYKMPSSFWYRGY